MVDLQQELLKREANWLTFVKFFFWTAGIVAVLMLLMWIFLV